MNARDKFTLGDRVILSMSGERANLGLCGAKHGIVAGFSRDETCVLVLLDGRYTKTAFHHSFWERTTRKRHGPDRKEP